MGECLETLFSIHYSKLLDFMCSRILIIIETFHIQGFYFDINAKPKISIKHTLCIRKTSSENLDYDRQKYEIYVCCPWVPGDFMVFLTVSECYVYKNLEILIILSMIMSRALLLEIFNRYKEKFHYIRDDLGKP